MSRAYFRTVRYNRISLRGKVLTCKGLNGELDGYRFCFIPYDNRPDCLTALWGTVNLYRNLHVGAEEWKTLWDKDEAILAPTGEQKWYFWEEVTDAVHTARRTPRTIPPD